MKYKMSMSAILLSVLVMNTLLSSAPRAEASQSTASTVVSGSISASIINVSVPTSLAFTVDPNNTDATYSSEALIQNNTNAPVTISLTGGGTSFRQSPTSAWKPVDYLPAELEWEDLGKTESESSLALGLIAKDATQWRVLNRTSTLWVKELNNVTGSVIIGELDPHTSAYMTFKIHHGNAFSEAKSCVYDIVWSFSLAE